LTLAPRKIILGGGIMQKDFLLHKIRAQVKALLNKYLNHPVLIDHTDEYIVPPALGNRSGVLGAIALIMDPGQ
jgi:fructokinase